MNPILNFERSAREYVILSLSLATILSLLPFTVLRYMTQDWAIAVLDSITLSIMIGFFVYVYKTRKTKVAGFLLAIVFLATEIVTVSLKGPTQLVWCFPATVGIYFLVDTPKAAMINALSLLSVTLIAESGMTAASVAAFVISMIATNVFIIVFAMRNQIQKRQLEELTLKDPLTGVHNRRAFDHFLDEFDQNRGLQDIAPSMIMLDIDHFKTVNDKHGHLAGDETLVRLVTLVKTQLHHDEKIFRVGGEEYVIAPLNMNLSTCVDFADRLRKIIEHSNISEKLGITISLGVAQYSKTETGRDWVKRADTALSEAKSLGRNQTKASPNSTPGAGRM